MNLLDKNLQLLPVMIVDDEIELLKALKRDLRFVAQVEAFDNVEFALDAFKSKAYSVVISDLKMPRMNGLDFLTQCSEINPNCQRILLTAFADLANLADSINKARLNLFLTKPWEPEDLQKAIEAAQRQNLVISENVALRKIALTDALTGLSNHRYFWERLDSEFARSMRYGRPLSLIIADIDDFKKYNDQFGHLEGDRVLQEVAKNLERNRRSMDTVARYGGEEFAIILPEATRPQAIEIAKRLLESTLELTKISLSLGVAAYPDDATSPTELVFKSDQALLKAKKNGKRQVLSALDLNS